MKKICISEKHRQDLESIIKQIGDESPSPETCRVLGFVQEGNEIDVPKAAMIYWAIEDTIDSESDIELYGDRALAFEILYDKLEEAIGVDSLRNINKPVRWNLQIDNLLQRFE